MSKIREIEKKIDEVYTNEVFTSKDFLDTTSYNNAKLILSRLISKGKINRVMDGFYYKNGSYISVYDFVDKIAKMNDWNICVYGEAALNYLNLSTQVPSKYIFISDGPYREYNVFNTVVKFKHTNKNIKNVSTKVATILEALKYLGKGRIGDNEIEIIKEGMDEQELLELKECAKKSSVWIYEIVERIVNYDDEIIKKRFRRYI